MKISVCAFFGNAKIKVDGAVTKANNVFQYLNSKFNGCVKTNFPSWKRHALSNSIKIIHAFLSSDIIVILPNEARLKIFNFFYKMFFYFRKPLIIYMVVGGWLPDFLVMHKHHKKTISKFSGVFVETKQMVEKSRAAGILNVYYSPVFTLRKTKTLNISTRTLNLNHINVCSFSRVTIDKGIILSIDAVKKANSLVGKNIFFLTIYGFMYQEDKDLILKKINDNSSFVRYFGVIEDDNVLEELSKNDILLFLTYFPFEGFPASLLEGIKAGLFPIVSNWKYNSEIISNNYNGFIVPAKNYDIPAEKLVYLFKNIETFKTIRNNSYRCALSFSPDESMKIVNDIIYEKSKQK